MPLVLTQLSVLSACRLTQIEKIAKTASSVASPICAAAIFGWPAFGVSLVVSAVIPVEVIRDEGRTHHLEG